MGASVVDDLGHDAVHLPEVLGGFDVPGSPDGVYRASAEDDDLIDVLRVDVDIASYHDGEDALLDNETPHELAASVRCLMPRLEAGPSTSRILCKSVSERDPPSGGQLIERMPRFHRRSTTVQTH